MRSPSGSPACWRVRSASCGPTSSYPNSGPVTSESVWGSRTSGLVGARVLVFLGLDILFSVNERQLKVNNRWLNFDRAHRDKSCVRSLRKVGPTLLNDSVTFWCDHTVATLWDIIVDILPLPEGMQLLEAERHRRSMKDLTREKFAQMPRGITVEPTLTKGELRVRWESAESYLAWKYCNAEIRITLHREGPCSGFRTDLLSSCGKT